MAAALFWISYGDPSTVRAAVQAGLIGRFGPADPSFASS